MGKENSEKETLHWKINENKKRTSYTKILGKNIPGRRKKQNKTENKCEGFEAVDCMVVLSGTEANVVGREVEVSRSWNTQGLVGHTEGLSLYCKVDSKPSEDSRE
jgi:hypothetical protein